MADKYDPNTGQHTFNWAISKLLLSSGFTFISVGVFSFINQIMFRFPETTKKKQTTTKKVQIAV